MLEYFEMGRPEGDGLCSDNDCPCNEVRIPWGTGNLYVSQKVVEMRRDAKTVEELAAKLQRIGTAMGCKLLLMDPACYNGILCCELAAKRRHLDLEVAAEDAIYWWNHGLVPLRVTPNAGLLHRLFRRRRSAPAAKEPAGPAEPATGSEGQDFVAWFAGIFESKGIHADRAAIEKGMEAAKAAFSRPVEEYCVISHPATLKVSRSAEMTREGPDFYRLRFSSAVPGGETERGKAYHRAACIASFYVAVSSIAETIGLSEYVIKPGETISLCDPKPVEHHPLNRLLEEVFNESILQ